MAGMTDFGYNDNDVTHQKFCRLIAHDNVAETVVVVLTDEPLPCWNIFEQDWKF